MPTIDMDVLSRLVRVVPAEEPYLHARLICVLAQSQPRDPQWMIAYVRLLNRLGMNAAAGQVLRALTPEVRQQPAICELETIMRDGPAGLIPWNSRRRRFEANLAALAGRAPTAATAVTSARDVITQRFELHQASGGRFHIKPVDGIWPPRWVPELDDSAAIAERHVRIERAGLLPPPLVFDGVGLGWELVEAHRQTRNVFLNASSTLYVVERRPEALAIAFHLHDWRELIADPSVCWFVGERAQDELRNFITADPTWPLTDHCFRLGIDAPPAEPSPVTVMSEVGQQRGHLIESLTGQLEQQYAGRDSSYWAVRFAQAVDQHGRATGTPLRILGLTSLHTTFLQFSMRDCLRGLEALGHETRLLIEPDPHRHLDAITALRTQIEFEPDLVILLSRLRSENTSLLHPSIPSVSWDQDSLPWVFDQNARPQLAWNDFLMGFAAATAPRRFGWPEHRCLPCEMAGSADAYSPEPLPDDDLAAYRCDVSYVSHASATPEAEAEAAAGWLPDERLRRVFRVAVERLLPDWMRGGEFPGPIMTAVLDAAECTGEPLTAEAARQVGLAVGRVGDRAFRHVALSWVAEWAQRTSRTFHLWGRGWDEHPELGRFACGAASNGHVLRCIYQASRINLQLMGYGFLHQRALDGLMAGAFFMARRSVADDQGTLLRELVSLMDRHAVDGASELHAVSDAGARERMVEIMIRCGRDPRLITPECLDVYRQGARGVYAPETVPHFDQIAFTDAASFAVRAERFLADDALRADCARDMNAAVVEQYSYDARMRQMLAFVRRGFDAQAAGGAVVCGQATATTRLQIPADRAGLAAPTG